MLYVKYGENRLQGFRGNVVWKCWWRTMTTDRRMPTYTVSSPMSLWLRWAKNLKLKTNFFLFLKWNTTFYFYFSESLFYILDIFRVKKKKRVPVRAKGKKKSSLILKPCRICSKGPVYMIFEGLDGVYWLVINGLIFCWLLIICLKFYWIGTDYSAAEIND